MTVVAAYGNIITLGVRSTPDVVKSDTFLTHLTDGNINEDHAGHIHTHVNHAAQGVHETQGAQHAAHGAHEAQGTQHAAQGGQEAHGGHAANGGNGIQHTTLDHINAALMSRPMHKDVELQDQPAEQVSEKNIDKPSSV